MPVPVINVVPGPVRQNFAKNYIKKVKKSKFFACGAYRHRSRLIKDLKNGPKKWLCSKINYFFICIFTSEKIRWNFHFACPRQPLPVPVRKSCDRPWAVDVSYLIVLLLLIFPFFGWHICIGSFKLTANNKWKNLVTNCFGDLLFCCAVMDCFKHFTIWWRIALQIVKKIGDGSLQWRIISVTICMGAAP